MRAALEEVPQLGDDLDETPLMLCTDSQAALATLASGAGAQKTALGAASSRRPRKRADRSAYIGTSPLRAPRKWTCGRAGERGLQSPTGWHLRTFELDTKAAGRAISKSATGTSAVIPGSRSDLWSDLIWPDIVMFICQSCVLKQFVVSQSYASFTVNSAK